MSLPYPRVRDACESCHRRKIRCRLLPGSPACQSCLTSGDSCLFAPRAKAGRPRRTHSEKLQRRQMSWLATENNCSRTASDNRHVESNAGTMAMLTADEMQFDAVVAFDDYWGSEKMAGMKDLDSAEFLGHNPTPTKGGGQIMNMEEFGDVDFHTYNSPPHEAGEASIVLNTVQHRTSTEIQEIQLYTFTSVAGILDFEAALKLCGNLDRSYGALRDGKSEAFEMRGIMELIEYTCATAASSSSTEKASTALLLAAIYKVLEICEIIIQQTGDGCSKADLWDCSFRLQRLDLALFQSFRLLKRMNQLDALKRVSELHACIGSTLQQELYRSMWQW
ncbi:hypothetical protein V8E51_012872 [Hyaloscypha variabilis]